jgi:hypothetical protein
LLKHRNLKILQQQPTTPADDSRSIGYAYKASLIGAAQQFDLTGDGLSFRFAGRSGLWRYALPRSGCHIVRCRCSRAAFAPTSIMSMAAAS